MGCKGYGCSGCCVCKPPECTKRFSVGQVWVSSTNRKHNIISVEPDLIVTRSDDTIVFIDTWYPDGRNRSHSHVILGKEYKEPRKATRDIYLVYNPTRKGGEPYFLDVLKDADPDEGKCSSTVILGKVTLTITEGEGMK